MTSSRLVRLFDECGQSPWLDNLKRDFITSGQLHSILDSGIRGLTSNPTIFQKAIQGSSDYDEQFRQLSDQCMSPIDSYWQLVIKDIQDALDIFQPLYQSSNRSDGFVSVEVDPNLAHDTAATETAARSLGRTSCTRQCHDKNTCNAGGHSSYSHDDQRRSQRQCHADF